MPHEPGRSHGPLERPSPQDGDLRLARIRRRIVLRWLVRHRCEAGNRHVGSGRVGPGARDPRRGLQAAGGESGSDPERLAEGERAGVRRRDTRGRRRRSTAQAEVTNIRSPLDPENAGQISADGHSALVEFQIRGDADLAVDKIDPILLGIAEAQAAHPQVFIGTFGDASVDKELEGAFMDDLKKAGLYSVPITLIILIVVFGALVAAGIPLLLALTAVLATFGLWAIPSHDLAERRVALRDGAPDRARRRGRLLDVLLEAGTRGARCRAEPRGGARDRRRDVRTLGAHLRRDGHHRHGGHALRRGRIRAVRRGDDARRRRRRDRLADGAAGRPVHRWATTSSACACRSSTVAVADDEEGRRLGRDRRPRPAPAGALGRALRRAAAAHRGARADPPHRRARHRHLPAGARRDEDVQPPPSRVPRHRDPGQRRRQGGGRHFDRGPGTRSASSSGGRSRPG